MTQKTAVEWLDQEIDKVWKGDIMYMELPRNVYYRLLKKAKAMEKEQIIKAASTLLWHNSSNSTEEAEKYYNETYKTSNHDNS